MIYGLTASVLVLGVSVFARLYWARDSARRALRRQRPGWWEWRTSCLFARLVPPAVLAFILLMLLSVTFEGPLTTQRWAVALAVLVGVLGNHVDREVSGGWQPYWRQCHDSLRAVLPTFMDGVHERHASSDEDCQALQFNAWHYSLLNGDERPIALKRIFNADPHP